MYEIYSKKGGKLNQKVERGVYTAWAFDGRGEKISDSV
jgi:hypothetical protein